MEDRIKRCKERTRWTRMKAFPVGVDVVARYYLSIDFCTSSYSCYWIIVEISTYLMIICFLSSRFFTSSSSSCFSSKVIWASLGELIYHFWNGFVAIYFRPSVSKNFPPHAEKCSKDCVIIGGRSKTSVDRWPYMGVFAVLGDIGLCHWPHRWVDGEQCKFKYWFIF